MKARGMTRRRRYARDCHDDQAEGNTISSFHIDCRNYLFTDGHVVFITR